MGSWHSEGSDREGLSRSSDPLGDRWTSILRGPGGTTRLLTDSGYPGAVRDPTAMSLPSLATGMIQQLGGGRTLGRGRHRRVTANVTTRSRPPRRGREGLCAHPPRLGLSPVDLRPDAGACRTRIADGNGGGKRREGAADLAGGLEPLVDKPLPVFEAVWPATRNDVGTLPAAVLRGMVGDPVRASTRRGRGPIRFAVRPGKRGDMTREASGWPTETSGVIQGNRVGFGACGAMVRDNFFPPPPLFRAGPDLMASGPAASPSPATRIRLGAGSSCTLAQA